MPPPASAGVKCVPLPSPSSVEAEPANPPDDALTCQACLTSIRFAADRVKVLPCDHILCAFCALRSQISRGFRRHKCPARGCGCLSRGNCYVKGTGGSTTRGEGVVSLQSTSPSERGTKLSRVRVFLTSSMNDGGERWHHHLNRRAPARSVRSRPGQGLFCYHRRTQAG